ncbi:hypothetical protein FQZ97_987500 [compost metagenome]
MTASPTHPQAVATGRLHPMLGQCYKNRIQAPIFIEFIANRSRLQYDGASSQPQRSALKPADNPFDHRFHVTTQKDPAPRPARPAPFILLCKLRRDAAAGRHAAGRLSERHGPDRASRRRKDLAHGGGARTGRSAGRQRRAARHRNPHWQRPAATARHPPVGHRGHGKTDRRPQPRHRQGGPEKHRRHHLPGGRRRRGRHPPARFRPAGNR